MELTIWGKIKYSACDIASTDEALPLSGDEILGKRNKSIKCCGNVRQIDESKLDSQGYRSVSRTSASICVKCKKRVRITSDYDY